MSTTAMKELDLANQTLYSQIYVGKVAENLVAARPKHPVSMWNGVCNEFILRSLYLVLM